jgi:hypothetical protein
MPRQSDDEESPLPSDSDNVTPPTASDRRKCGAERVQVSFSGDSVSDSEGSSSVPSPVKEIKFETRGRAQEQSALYAAHVTAIGYRPALRYPFGGVGSNSIPSPVKRIQAPQSKHIADDDEDEWEVTADYATNHQQAMAHDIANEIYRHSEKFMHESGTVMQPDYAGKPEDLYLWCLMIGESKTCRQQACPMRYSCGCDTSIRITEKKQTVTLKLETIQVGVHD